MFFRSHVLRDLLPYICVFEDCDNPEARYPTTKLLKQHMSTSHFDQEWRCPRCKTTDSSEVVFCDPAKFSSHLTTIHADAVSGVEVDLIIEHAVYRVPHTLSSCPFCKGHERDDRTSSHEHWETLLRHITRDHMQYLAMLSLPWDTGASCRGSHTRQSSIGSSRERIEQELEELREEERMGEFEEQVVGVDPPFNTANISTLSMGRMDPQSWINKLPGLAMNYQEYSDGTTTAANPTFPAPPWPNFTGTESRNLPWLVTEVLVKLYSGEVLLEPEITAVAEKGFFLSLGDWTSYRRNYFSVSCSFRLLGFDVRPLLIYHGGEVRFVRAMGMRLTAMDHGSEKTFELAQVSPKADQGPKRTVGIVNVAPTPKNHSVHPADSPQVPDKRIAEGVSNDQDPHQRVQSNVANAEKKPSLRRMPALDFLATDKAHFPKPTSETTHTFERVQFKQATANNGKRRAAQQYFNLVVELHVDIRTDGEETPMWVMVARRLSERLVVRGRSPSHYVHQAEEQGGPFSGPLSGPLSRGGVDQLNLPEYNNSGAFSTNEVQDNDSGRTWRFPTKLKVSNLLQ